MVEVVTAGIKDLTLTSATTEYSWTVPTNCVGVSFQCLDATDVFFAFATGKVATPTGDYATLKAGTAYTLPDGLLLRRPPFAPGLC